MTAAKKTAAKAPARARAQLTEAKPKAASPNADKVLPHGDGPGLLGIGVDPRGSAPAEDVRASASTFTNETAATANDAPGAGGHVRPRRALAQSADMVQVSVPRAFILTHGGEFHYGPHTTEMPAEHAEHWYSKTHGVTLK